MNRNLAASASGRLPRHCKRDFCQLDLRFRVPRGSVAEIRFLNSGLCCVLFAMGRRLGMLLVAAPLLPSLVMFGQIADAGVRGELQASAALAVLGYLATMYVLPTFTPFLSRRGLTGKDLCKKGTASADKEMRVPVLLNCFGTLTFLCPAATYSSIM